MFYRITLHFILSIVVTHPTPLHILRDECDSPIDGNVRPLTLHILLSSSSESTNRCGSAALIPNISTQRHRLHTQNQRPYPPTG